MAYKISDECTMCGACVPECPVDCISEGDDKYVIDAAKCTDCGACAEVCPVEAAIPLNGPRCLNSVVCPTQAFFITA